jgi:hypothetical protein
VPLVWWLTYFSVFGDLFIGGALALDAMLGEGAIDRCHAARRRSLRWRRLAGLEAARSTRDGP